MPDWVSRLRDILQRHWGGKVAAVVLATATWYGIQSVINFETRIREVPVNLVLPDGWATLDRSASTVDIVFRGSQEDIRFLNRDQVKVELDLRQKVLNGTNLLTRVKILPKHVNAPSAVRPIQIRPAEITVSLDRQEEKTVPVKADFQGSPAEEYEVERWACAPTAVAISGPRSRLLRIESVTTAPIDLEGRTKSFRKTRVPVQLPPETVLVESSPGQVTVEVTMGERTTTEVWPGVPVDVLTAPGPREHVQVVPTEVTVSVRGRAEVLKKMDARDIRVYADGSEVEKSGAYDLPVRVHAPPALAVFKIDPAVVRVTLGDR
ncbi:MAG: hypothetical protein KKC51_09990 [Verrucomicrobia bacterium]|nr:hypothetical protein [Verrucomicrobiota bacterium]